MIASLLLAAATATAAASASPSEAQLQPYFQGAVVCKARSGAETCHLWLNPDGGYQVFYDLGAEAPKPKDDSGPFQLEGREGRYSIVARDGRTALCLSPAQAAGWTYAMQARGLLYGGAGCSLFSLHRAGESWAATDGQGRAYTLWLLDGR